MSSPNTFLPSMPIKYITVLTFLNGLSCRKSFDIDFNWFCIRRNIIIVERKLYFRCQKTTNLVSNIWYSNSFSNKWRELLLCFQFEEACNEIQTNSSSSAIVSNEKWNKSYWRMKRARKENLLLFHEIFSTEENCQIMQHDFHATKDHK